MNGNRCDCGHLAAGGRIVYSTDRGRRVLCSKRCFDGVLYLEALDRYSRTRTVRS